MAARILVYRSPLAQSTRSLVSRLIRAVELVIALLVENCDDTLSIAFLNNASNPAITISVTLKNILRTHHSY